MAKCIRCGKRGLFLALDAMGTCEECFKKDQLLKSFHKPTPWAIKSAASTPSNPAPASNSPSLSESDRLVRENERLARENERLSREIAELRTPIVGSSSAVIKENFEAAPDRTTGCLDRILKFLLKLLAVMLVVLFVVIINNKSEKPNNTAAKPTTAPTTPAAVPTAKTKNPAPGIAGSNAYDVIGSLRDMGYDIERQKSNAGYFWQFDETVDGVSISMDITANKDYEICAASFIMNHGDNGFLYFGSTLPYDAANKTLTAELIQSDVEKTITIGDAIWTIRLLPYGKWLHVIHPDYEDWIISNLPLE